MTPTTYPTLAGELRGIATELRREAARRIDADPRGTYRLITEGVPGGRLLVAADDLEHVAAELEADAEEVAP